MEKQLKSNDIRTKTDIKPGKLNGKIKNAQLEKIPYMVIIGEKEIEQQNISIRDRLQGNQGTSTIDDFIKKIKKHENEVIK